MTMIALTVPTSDAKRGSTTSGVASASCCARMNRQIPARTRVRIPHGSGPIFQRPIPELEALHKFLDQGCKSLVLRHHESSLFSTSQRGLLYRASSYF